MRKVGYSKERRVDPQIVVGLLVDRTGFPLEVGCFEGNTAETTTLVPIITAFQSRHDLGDAPMVIAESLLDRLINTSHQILMDGPSYRPRKRPGATAPVDNAEPSR